MSLFNFNKERKKRVELFFQEDVKKKIKESEKRFETILESSNDGIIMLDEKDNIVKVNKKLLKITHYPKNFFINKNIKELNNLFGKNIKSILKNAGKRYNKQVKLTGKDKKIDIEINTYFIKHLKKIIGKVIIIRDISIKNKLRKLEIEREKEEVLNRLKEKFLMRVSHELRHPLMPIIGYSELALKKLSGNLKEYIEKILLNAMQLRDLINNLLMITMIESGKLGIKLKKTNIKKLIEDILSSYKTELKLKNIKLIRDYKCEGTLRIDPILLTKVLNNIINNAVTFTKKGHIKIIIDKNKNNTIIKVIDTGKGMKKSEIKKVIQGFSYLYSEDFSKEYKGFAVSLLISKLIIEKFNGELEIKSKKGKGTTITILLPEKIN